MIPRREKTYIAAADLLRVFCVGMVAWFHIWQQSWLDPGFRLGGMHIDLQRIVRRGYMGVDLMLERPREITVRWFGPGKSKYILRSEALRNDPAVHYNCAQAVLLPFAPDAGLDEKTAARLTANFGAGMKRGSVCGAIAGGLMVLGLYGADDPASVGEYYRRLRASHDGIMDCAELLRVDRERGGDRKAHCDGMVCECLTLAEEILRKQGRI